ncbi:MAG: hypothetical protein AB7V17_03785 [Hyphomonadaceae bacterium]
MQRATLRKEAAGEDGGRTMKPHGYLITWVMAILPALAALWTTSA